jgi:hypothetical protein
MDQPDRLSSRPDRRDLLIALAVTAAGVAFHLFYIHHGVRNWIDLGVAASDAVRILDGDHFGRDFVAPYGPGRYYLTALWFLLFGTSLFTMNLLYLCLMAITNLITYLLARRFLPRSLALAVAFLVVAAHGPVHKIFISLFSVLFFWAAFRALERRTLFAGFLMGLTGAVSGFFRYDVGALALLGGILVTVAVVLSGLSRTPRAGRPVPRPCGEASQTPPPSDRLRGALRLTAGFLAGGGIVVLPAGMALLLFCDAAWVFDHILHRIEIFDFVRYDDPTLDLLLTSGEDGALLEGVLTLLLLAGPFAALAFGVYDVFVKKKGVPGVQLLLLGLAGIFLLNQWRLIPRFIRLMQAGPFLFTGLAVLAFRVRGLCEIPAVRRRALLCRAACTAPFLAVFFFLVAMGWYLWEYTGYQSQDSVAVLRSNESFMGLERGQCWVRRKRCSEMESVIGLVQKLTEKGEPILAGPACPIVYFLADRPNPTPCSDSYLYFRNESAETEMIEAVERREVRLFVDWPRPIGGLSIEDAAPRLYAYIKRNFVVREQVGRFVVMMRR